MNSLRIVVVVSALAALGLAALQAQPSTPPTRTMAGPVMSVADAHRKSLAGEVVLVDVRTPEEWSETGIPASAKAISMADKDFMNDLMATLGNDKSKPVAIICRTGNRTTKLQAELSKAGFTNVINVVEGVEGVEGVAGGPSGQGWLKAGLPTRPGSSMNRPAAPVSTKP